MACVLIAGYFILHICKCISFEFKYPCEYMFFRLYPPLAVGAQQPATIDPTLDLCTRYPLRLGRPRQCGIRSLPDTSTHDQHWELNPRPSDLESNALLTWPHASTVSHMLPSGVPY